MTQRIDAARLQPLLLGVALVAALLAAITLVLAGRAMQQQSQLREHMASLTSLSQNIPLQAGAAVRGSAPAFDALGASRVRLERVIDEINAGKSAWGPLASPSARLLGQESGWPALLEQSQAVLDGREAALQAQQTAADVREKLPQLLTVAVQVLKQMGPSRSESVGRSFERFELRAQALEQDLNGLAGGTVPVEAAARRLTDSLNYLAEVAAGVNGEPNQLGLVAAPPPAAASAAELLALQRDLAEQVQRTIDLADPLEQMQAARNALTETGAMLGAGLAQLDMNGAVRAGSLLASPWLPLLFIVVALAAVAALAWLHRELASLRKAAEQQAHQNERNQQAILRLLDELSSLADGDLTVQATVTEDITGAIADSINYAIDALRELVVTINDSADQARRRHAPDPGAVDPPREGIVGAVEADRRGVRVDRGHGGYHGGSLGQRRAILRRRAPFGRYRAQGRRRRAPHHRRHERDPREHPGDLASASSASARARRRSATSSS
jgi:twitching motility protein PilJ